MPHPIEPIKSLWSAWADAAAEVPVHDALAELYDRLGREIESRGPTCWLSGRCCKFDSYGHRLYVTGLEIAWLVRHLDGHALARLRNADLPDLDGCPFQSGGLCMVHALRPLGCRIYFCDPTAEHWQNDLYERFLGDLRGIHESGGIPYRYMEWRHGLAEARAAFLLHC